MATQHSRTLLEKELVAVQKRLAEEKSRTVQMDQLLTLARERGEGSWGEENMRLKELLDKQQVIMLGVVSNTAVDLLWKLCIVTGYWS